MKNIFLISCLLIISITGYSQCCNMNINGNVVGGNTDTATAVDDTGNDGDVGAQVNINADANDTACSLGVTTYSAPYNFVNITAADVTGTGPSWSVTPTATGLWSFDYDILCDGVVTSSATVSGTAEAGTVAECDVPANCGTANCPGNLLPIEFIGHGDNLDGFGGGTVTTAFQVNINPSFAWTDPACEDDYTIDWGDGNTTVIAPANWGQGNEPDHTYAAAGEYDIVLTMTDQCINQTQTVSYYVTVDAAGNAFPRNTSAGTDWNGTTASDLQPFTVLILNTTYNAGSNTFDFDVQNQSAYCADLTIGNVTARLEGTNCCTQGMFGGCETTITGVTVADLSQVIGYQIEYYRQEAGGCVCEDGNVEKLVDSFFTVSCQ